jgi:serine/threonine protein kinase
MDTLIGSRIGAFDVVALLGAGAMGEVYRARDTRLERDVALKVVRAVHAHDADHLLRFEREARILAALNHPNIAAIYGVEDVPIASKAGTRALVLELVEGETLDERIAGSGAPRAVAIDEAIAIATQIASALDAAHEKGIVHRDLKPANIKLTASGLVKVLDFGLAYTAVAEPDTAAATLGATAAGLVVGTPAYMSPEQARGLPIDPRADIWAFGATLFELLTGAPAFARGTLADTIAAILDGEPDWAGLPAGTPTHLEDLLRWCLAKDPRQRLRNIGDARLRAPAAAGAPAHRTDAVRNVRLQRVTDFPGVNESPAISPDGKMIAFVAAVNGSRQIWVKLLSGGSPLQITRGTAHHDSPRWAPDSSAILYYSPSATPGEEGTIWETAALGGSARPITSASSGADVSRSGRRIAFFRITDRGTNLVTTDRHGRDERVVASIVGFTDCRCARWSPDDRFIAVEMIDIGQFSERLCTYPVDGGAPVVVASAGSLAGCAWTPDGTALLYSSSAGSTMPYPRTCNLRMVDYRGGNDRQVTFGDVSHVSPDIGPGGTVVACRSRSTSDIWRLPCGGTPEENVRAAVRITNQTGQVQAPSVSADGREIAYLSDTGGHANVWVAGIDGTEPRQLTFERDPAVSIGAPLWSPKGRDIAFIRAEDGLSLWLARSDGLNIRPFVGEGYAACWSRDGEWIYCNEGRELATRIKKVRAIDGTTAIVRPGHGAIVGATTFYFCVRASTSGGTLDWDICSASPEDAPPATIARVAGARVPLTPLFVQGVLSPDECWIAMPLKDGDTTNIWTIPTTAGKMRPLTDFGRRPVLIARQVSWAPDGNAIYAAVAELTADVVLYEGLLS